jgi:TPR repeat protein
MYTQKEGVEQDVAKGLGLLNKAMHQNHSGALLHLGRACMFGQICPVDINVSIYISLYYIDAIFIRCSK